MAEDSITLRVKDQAGEETFFKVCWFFCREKWYSREREDFVMPPLCFQLTTLLLHHHP